MSSQDFTTRTKSQFLHYCTIFVSLTSLNKVLRDETINCDGMRLPNHCLGTSSSAAEYFEKMKLKPQENTTGIFSCTQRSACVHKMSRNCDQIEKYGGKNLSKFVIFLVEIQLVLNIMKSQTCIVVAVIRSLQSKMPVLLITGSK